MVGPGVSVGGDQETDSPQQALQGPQSIPILEKTVPQLPDGHPVGVGQLVQQIGFGPGAAGEDLLGPGPGDPIRPGVAELASSL